MTTLPARPIEPTERDHALEAWTAYLETGRMKAAASRLNVHEVTVRKRIAELRERYGVKTNAQLADVLAREGRMVG